MLQYSHMYNRCKILRRYSWGNSYRRRKWVHLSDFKSWRRLFAFYLTRILVIKDFLYVNMFFYTSIDKVYSNYKEPSYIKTYFQIY